LRWRFVGAFTERTVVQIMLSRRRCSAIPNILLPLTTRRLGENRLRRGVNRVC
jgi:hypothetical protein